MIWIWIWAGFGFDLGWIWLGVWSIVARTALQEVLGGPMEVLGSDEQESKSKARSNQKQDPDRILIGNPRKS